MPSTIPLLLREQLYNRYCRVETLGVQKSSFCILFMAGENSMRALLKFGGG
jgi:hypothetical protein